jgi:hypothetical protein
LTYQTKLTTAAGRVYRPRACGRARPDGTWEGWLEFVPEDGSAVVRSARETSQPNLTTLEYWATGLTPVYLDGALDRALAGPLEVKPAPAPQAPFYDGPAPSIAASADPPITGTTPVLDPFAVYRQSETLLREQLEALSEHELRQIARGYRLATADVDIEAMTAPELIARIIAGVRTRLAA